MMTYKTPPRGPLSLSITVACGDASGACHVFPTSRALRQVELHLRLRVPRVGRYVIMVEYAAEADQLSEAAVHVQSPGADLAGWVDIYSCKYW